MSSATSRNETQTANPEATTPATWKITSPTDLPTEPERRAFLEKTQPRLDPRLLAEVKPIVIDLVLATDTVAPTSLSRRLGIGCAFGIWCLRNTPDGAFDPPRDFVEDRIGDFVDQYDGLTGNSPATLRSDLRKLGLMGAKPVKRTKGRRRAQPPYPKSMEDRYWYSASRFYDNVAYELRTLLALTFGAGLMAEEFNQMRASQIIKVNGRTVVQAIRNDFLREVPVYGEYGHWLQERAAQTPPEELVLRPALTKRGNAVSNLIASATRRRDELDFFAGFKAERARYSWLCHLMTKPLDFNTLRSVAGVGNDSNLLSDLTIHLPYVSPAQARQALDRVHLHQAAA